ncbi:dehydrogenase [Streptococcus pneumoniae]|nr:dehydrogenase [Streptococcus pneumoniae]
MVFRFGVNNWGYTLFPKLADKLAGETFNYK